MIKMTRIYTGSDGQSHFEDIEFPDESEAASGLLSAALKPTSISFRKKNGRIDSDWHRVPHKQMVFLLEGWIEIEIGNGSKRRFHAGDVFLVEDTTGQGHKDSSMNRKVVSVHLD